MPHETNDGGQAFPQLNSTGMTLRDWFAGQSLAGILEMIERRMESIDDPTLIAPMLIVPMAYDIADAMIEARKR